jgi:hypothetical protein
MRERERVKEEKRKKRYCYDKKQNSLREQIESASQLSTQSHTGKKYHSSRFFFINEIEQD